MLGFNRMAVSTQKEDFSELHKVMQLKSYFVKEAVTLFEDNMDLIKRQVQQENDKIQSLVEMQR